MDPKKTRVFQPQIKKIGNEKRKNPKVAISTNDNKKRKDPKDRKEEKENQRQQQEKEISKSCHSNSCIAVYEYRSTEKQVVGLLLDLHEPRGGVGSAVAEQ